SVVRAASPLGCRSSSDLVRGGIGDIVGLDARGSLDGRVGEAIIRIGNDRIAEVVERSVVDRNQHMLSAQKCDDRHRDNRDRQGIVPDALPANRAFEFGIMGLHIPNDRVHLAVDQSELLGQCRDALLDRLKQEGVKIDAKRMNESYGRFAWIYDLDGNKIEL